MMRLLIFGMLTMCSAASALASTLVIDFDGDIIFGVPIPSSFDNIYYDVTDSGFIFTSADDEGGQSGVGVGENWIGPDGSNALTYCPGCTANMISVANQLFSLHSVELKNLIPEPGDDFLTITGFLAGGGEVTANLAATSDWQTFSFGAEWTNLEEVEFGATVGSGFDAIYLDNVGVSVVPIPAAVWLFGSALAGLGWRLRKQSV